MMVSTGTLIQCIQRMGRGCFGSRRYMWLPPAGLRSRRARTATEPPRWLLLVHLVATHLVATHLAATHLVATHLVLVRGRRCAAAHDSQTQTQAHHCRDDATPDLTHAKSPYFSNAKSTAS